MEDLVLVKFWGNPMIFDTQIVQKPTRTAYTNFWIYFSGAVDHLQEENTTNKLQMDTNFTLIKFWPILTWPGHGIDLTVT